MVDSRPPMKMVYEIGGERYSIGVDSLEEAAKIAERLQRLEGARCHVPVDGEGDPLCTPEDWARRVSFHGLTRK